MTDAALVDDVLIPMHCPSCAGNFQWKLTPREVDEWASCFLAHLAHLAGMRAIDGRILDTTGGSDG